MDNLHKVVCHGCGGLLHAMWLSPDKHPYCLACFDSLTSLAAAQANVARIAALEAVVQRRGVLLRVCERKIKACREKYGPERVGRISYMSVLKRIAAELGKGEG